MRTPLSAETKAKIAAKARGRRHTPEARAKMSATHRAKAVNDPVQYGSHLPHPRGADHPMWKGGIKRGAAWRVRHNACVRAWAARNRDKRNLTTINYRARKRNAVGSFTAKEWRAKIALLGGVCIYCGEDRPLTVDHKIPLSRGGTNDIANVVPACGLCNSRKQDRTAIEYLARKAA